MPLVGGVSNVSDPVYKSVCRV